jgi:hypothetical protein
MVEMKRELLLSSSRLIAIRKSRDRLMLMHRKTRVKKNGLNGAMLCVHLKFCFMV